MVLSDNHRCISEYTRTQDVKYLVILVPCVLHGGNLTKQSWEAKGEYKPRCEVLSNTDYLALIVQLVVLH